MRAVPPLMMISGSEGFLRKRFLSQTEKRVLNMGWKVEHIGSDRSELVSSLNGTAHLFLSGGTMVILETTGKLDLPLIQQFFDDPPEDLSLLIYSPGQIKK